MVGTGRGTYGTHVEGCADVGGRKLGLGRQLLRQSKITNLNVLAGVHEDVARFDVTVQNRRHLARGIHVTVTSLQRHHNLCKHLPNKLFLYRSSATVVRHMKWFGRWFGICVSRLQISSRGEPHTPLHLALLDEGTQVTTLTVLHDDKNGGRRLVDDSIIVPNDKWVAQFTQDVHLQDYQS